MALKKAKRIKRGTEVKRRGFRSSSVARLDVARSAPPFLSDRTDGKIRELLFEKTNTALQYVINSASKDAVLEALRALTPFDSLVTVTSSEGAIASGTAHTDDPLRAAKARAAKHLSRLLALEGGPIGVKEVSERLGISRAAVDKRRNAGTLIGIADRSRSILYPSWQFTERGVLKGLETVLRALDVEDSWMRMQFFLTHEPDLQARPLDSLRKGQLEEVISAANRYGHQGGSGDRSSPSA